MSRLLAFLFVIFLEACSSFHKSVEQKVDPVQGDWCTHILVIDAVYSFKGKSFEQMTFLEGKRIGGSRGSISAVTDKLILINQSEIFAHGLYMEEPREYSFEYFTDPKIGDSYLAISPSFSSGDLIEMIRCSMLSNVKE
jgi:hypothetical protein